MNELAIVGGGFWGASAALLAREKDVDTILIDDFREQGASRCASGYFGVSWYTGGVIGKMLPPNWTKQDIEKSVDWMTHKAIAPMIGQFYTTYPKPDVVRFKPDIRMVQDVNYFLSLPTLTSRRQVLYLIAEKEAWRLVTDGGDFTAKKVLLTTGAFTDELLARSELPTVGVRGLRGRSIVFANPEKSDLKFDVPFAKSYLPYKELTIRKWDKNYFHIGATTEKTDKGNAPLKVMQRQLELWVGKYEQVCIIDGMRPVRDEGIYVDYPVKDDHTLVVATGGHRAGIGLAHAAAKYALDKLGIS